MLRELMDRSVGAEIVQRGEEGMVRICGLSEVGVCYACGGVVLTVCHEYQLMIPVKRRRRMVVQGLMDRNTRGGRKEGEVEGGKEVLTSLSPSGPTLHSSSQVPPSRS